MKAIVVYYSAGGNTKKIAKAIHRGVNRIIETDIAPVKEIHPQSLIKYDLIGIGSPIWYFREPANVRLFIYNMPKMEGKHCFLFCTHGAAPYGIFASMASALQKRGLKIIGWADWYGSVEIVLHMPKPYFTDGHPDDIDLTEAEGFGRDMAERFLQIVSGRTDLIPQIPKGENAPLTFRSHPLREPFPGARPTRRVNMAKCKYPSCTICVDNCPVKAIDFSKEPPLFKRESCWNCSLCDRLCPTNAIELEPAEVREIMRTQKRIDTAKCSYPKCKLCVENCPMDSIDFSTQPPTFKHSCEGCDLCWAICPKGAIELTNLEKTHKLLFERMLKEKENGTLTKSFIFKSLAEAEAKGVFRRLVPLERIGWDTPLYKVQKTPRLTILEDP